MTVQLLINEAAQKEWDRAAAWYEVKQTGPGDRFVSTVKTKLELISRYPERYLPSNFEYFEYFVVAHRHDREAPDRQIQTLQLVSQIYLVEKLFLGLRSSRG